MAKKGEVRRSLTFTVFTTSVIINTIACVVVDVTTSTDHTCTKMLARIIGNTNMDCFTTTTLCLYEDNKQRERERELT